MMQPTAGSPRPVATPRQVGDYRRILAASQAPQPVQGGTPVAAPATS